MADKFIVRLLYQKLKRYIEPVFAKNSFAYQEGKGIQVAVMKLREYAENGYTFVAEIDIKDFFDSISLERIMSLIEEMINDKKVLALIKSYLYCSVSNGDGISEKKKGLIQGNSMSPILSNLYLHSLDEYMDEQTLNWIRFADNIYICEGTQEAAIVRYNEICEKIRSEYGLDINLNKSGVHDIYEKMILGYDFVKLGNGIDVRKHSYTKKNSYNNWHPCVVQHINREYHILQDGILNKKDYALLFENETEKHHIPVEVIDQLNIYGEVAVTPSVLKTIGDRDIRISFFDKYGNLMGNYIPQKKKTQTSIILKQCELYMDAAKRLETSRSMELAGLHNIKANLKYYDKRKDISLGKYIEVIANCIKEMTDCQDVEKMLLIEARARQTYMSAFNDILAYDEFRFTCRSKRPPKDELNSLISFGNTLMYNNFLQLIWKSSLDSRIGVIHSTNRRNHSLNLDFADIFKPVISDRVIFSLINNRQLRADEHFEHEGEGVFLNSTGKRIFLNEFEDKLDTKIVVKGESLTYRKLMRREVMNFQKMLVDGEKYKPYKYY
jgi:CRISPR-associated endonuclease Cas1 subtype I-B